MSQLPIIEHANPNNKELKINNMSQRPILIKDNSVPSNTKETPQPKKPFFSYMTDKVDSSGLGGGLNLVIPRILQAATILIGAFIVYKVLDISIKKK